MTNLTDQDDKAIKAMGLGPDNAGQDHPVRKDNGGDASDQSLRDYFAAHAMQAMLSTESETEGYYHSDQPSMALLSERSYQIADAMLSERAKK